MAKNDTPEPVKLADVDENTSIWKVHLDSLREQDVNARVMSSEKFRILSNNIKEEGSLESLPLCYKLDNGRNEFGIISGHHRVRACRAACVMVIPILVINRHLSHDEIVSKQIAHNSLSGFDDKDVLKQLYDSISDINAKIASGVSETELGNVEVDVDMTEVKIDKEFEPILIMFTKEDKENLDRIIEELDVPEYEKMIADIRDFKAFSKLCNRVSKKFDVRNIAGIMALIIKLAREKLNDEAE